MLAPAAATVAVGSSFAEWARPEGDDAGELCAPWMFDANGAAVMLPADAIGLRARYWPDGARGIGELVEDDDGQPVFIPRNTTIEQFRSLVGYRPGRYKLIAIDRSFQFLDRVPLVATTIKPAAAARAGVVVRDPSTAAPSTGNDANTLSQVLAFVRETNAHNQAVTAAAFEQNARALDQIASLQRDANESQRHTTTQLATVVGPVSGVLSAAGSSGVIKKTLALDAATAGAPVTVQMMPANANDTAPTTAPRNAAGATAAATAAAAEKGSGVGEALVAMGIPFVERIGAATAYAIAKKADMPEEYARSIAGMVQGAAQVATKMMQGDGDAPPTTTTAEPSATVGVAARVGAELLAHVGQIQAGLSADDRAWVFGMMSRPGLIDALKPSVAALTIDEGIAAVRNLRAVDGALSTDDERRFFDLLLQPDRLPRHFRKLFVDSSAEHAIAYLRQHAATIADIAATKPADADADAGG